MYQVPTQICMIIIYEMMDDLKILYAVGLTVNKSSEAVNISKKCCSKYNGFSLIVWTLEL